MLDIKIYSNKETVLVQSGKNCKSPCFRKSRGAHWFIKKDLICAKVLGSLYGSTVGFALPPGVTITQKMKLQSGTGTHR